MLGLAQGVKAEKRRHRQKTSAAAELRNQQFSCVRSKVIPVVN